MRQMADSATKIPAANLKTIADAGDTLEALGQKAKVYGAEVINAFASDTVVQDEADAWDSIGDDIVNATNSALAYFGIIEKGGKQRSSSADKFEAESLLTPEELAMKPVIANIKKPPVDPRVKADQEAKLAAIEKEGDAMEKAVAARDKAEADSMASQLTINEQLQAATAKSLDLQEYIASSEGIDQVNAQAELIKLEQTKLDLVEKVAKAEQDAAQKKQDFFQQQMDKENAEKAAAYKEGLQAEKALQEVQKDRAEEAMKFADDNLAKAKQGLEDVFTGKVKKPTKAETKLAAQMSTAMGEDVVQANKFGAEGGLGTKQLDATGKVIKGLGSTGGLGGGARKDMPKGSAEAIARFNLAKQRQEAAKGNLQKTNEILDLINKGINGAK
jgi:hypothetical protein